MTRINQAGPEDGVGMIDTLVATVLLGIAVVAFMAGFSYTSAGARENRERIQAVMLAQETMEELKRNDGLTAATMDLTIDSSVTVNNVKYSLDLETLTISDISALTNLIPVQLTVGWTEAGVTRSLALVEYIYLN